MLKRDIKEQGEEMPSEILEAPEVDAKTQLYTLTIKYKIAKQIPTTEKVNASPNDENDTAYRISNELVITGKLDSA